MEFLAYWSVLGLFIAAEMKDLKAGNKKAALWQLFICGPLMWAVFVPISIIVIWKSKRAQKRLESEGENDK